jgi:hypothetical protein
VIMSLPIFSKAWPAALALTVAAWAAPAEDAGLTKAKAAYSAQQWKEAETRLTRFLRQSPKAESADEAAAPQRVETKQVRQTQTAEGGMRQTAGDRRHATRHHIGADNTASNTGQQPSQHGAHEEIVLECLPHQCVPPFCGISGGGI